MKLLEKISNMVFGKAVPVEYVEAPTANNKVTGVTHTLTGNKRYRVDCVGFFSRKQVLILQLEVKNKGTYLGEYFPHDLISVDETNYRDALVQDLTVFK